MQIMPATGKELPVGDIHEYRAQHPWRRQVHGPADDALLRQRKVQREEPDAVRVRELQRRAGQHRADAQRSGKSGLDPDKWFNNVEM